MTCSFDKENSFKPHCFIGGCRIFTWKETCIYENGETMVVTLDSQRGAIGGPREFEIILFKKGWKMAKYIHNGLPSRGGNGPLMVRSWIWSCRYRGTPQLSSPEEIKMIRNCIWPDEFRSIKVEEASGEWKVIVFAIELSWFDALEHHRNQERNSKQNSNVSVNKRTQWAMPNVLTQGYRQNLTKHLQQENEINKGIFKG